MKFRSSFVANSSSASFIIDKKHLTDKQIKHIYLHIEYGQLKKFYKPYSVVGYDRWDINEDENHIKGNTTMDNFDMLGYLTSIIGIDKKNIKWEEGLL